MERHIGGFFSARDSDLKSTLSQCALPPMDDLSAFLGEDVFSGTVNRGGAFYGGASPGAGAPSAVPGGLGGGGAGRARLHSLDGEDSDPGMRFKPHGSLDALGRGAGGIGAALGGGSARGGAEFSPGAAWAPSPWAAAGKPLGWLDEDVMWDKAARGGDSAWGQGGASAGLSAAAPAGASASAAAGAGAASAAAASAAPQRRQSRPRQQAQQDLLDGAFGELFGGEQQDDDDEDEEEDGDEEEEDDEDGEGEDEEGGDGEEGEEEEGEGQQGSGAEKEEGAGRGRRGRRGSSAGSGRGSSGAPGRRRGGASAGSGARALTAEEKRQGRLERNRLSARLSRLRKKDYITLLEGRATALQLQVHRKRLEHAAAITAVLEEQRTRLLSTVEPLAYKEAPTVEEDAVLIGACARQLCRVCCAAPPPTQHAQTQHTHAPSFFIFFLFADAAAQLVDRFGPNCPERRAVRDFHFDCLQRLLLPPHMKFFLWLLFQSKEISSSGAGEEGAGAGAGGSSGSSSSGEGGAPVSLWVLLMKELGLTHEQGERFRAQLQRILGGKVHCELETWRLEFAVAYMARLRSIVSFASARAQAQLEGVRAILTPAQLVRFMAWGDRNARAISAVLAAPEGGAGGEAGEAGAGAGFGADAGQAVAQRA